MRLLLASSLMAALLIGGATSPAVAAPPEFALPPEFAAPPDFADIIAMLQKGNGAS